MEHGSFASSLPETNACHVLWSQRRHNPYGSCEEQALRGRLMSFDDGQGQLFVGRALDAVHEAHGRDSATLIAWRVRSR